MSGTIDKHIARWITFLETKYISTSDAAQPVDFAQKTQYFTLDVIGDLAFGQAFGFLDQDADVFDFISNTRDFFPVTVLIANLPSLVPLLHSWPLTKLLPKASDGVGFGAFLRYVSFSCGYRGGASPFALRPRANVLNSVANKKAADRFEPGAVPQRDMLGSFIKHGLTQEEASRESLLNVVAGADTTATVIRVAMLYLLSNPPAYRKLQVEIDDATRDGRASSPVTDAEARQMPYLQGVIKEAIRMKSAAGGLFFKSVPPGGDMIDGKLIPGGTQIGTSWYSMLHSKKTFGEDAALFMPERWLRETDEARLAYMASVVYLVFSSGKYRCLGMHVALMELNKVFVEVSPALSRSFDGSSVLYVDIVLALQALRLFPSSP